MFTYLLILLVTFAGYVRSTSNNTLQLPITITPLLQNSIQRDNFTNNLIQLNETFFRHVTFSDIVKGLDFDSVPQLKKHVKSLVILGLAAIGNDLTVDKFEFLNSSKWTIIMTVEELANVSKNITLPLNEETRLIAIQEAMFTILEKRFQFNTKEVAERLNTTVDKVYAFLEPGWIKVVNFITEKNILTVSRNYTIPPFYIAKAINMSLPELYNSTLPELEDILTNKIDVIKEAAERLKRSSSVAEQTTTMAEQPSLTTQIDVKTSSISNSMSLSGKSSTNILLPNSSMADFTTSLKVSTTEIHSKISSSTNAESTFQPTVQKSIPTPSPSPSSSAALTPTPSPALVPSPLPSPTSTKNQPILSMYNSSVSMKISTQVPQGESSATLQTDEISQLVISQLSTPEQHTSMLQPPATKYVLSTRTQVVFTITSKSSLLLDSSKMQQKSTTQRTSSSMIVNVLDATVVSASKGLSMTMVSSAQTSSSGNTVSSYDMTVTKSVDAVKISSVEEITSTLVVASSLLMTTPSHKRKSIEISKFHTSSQLTKTTEYGKTSSWFPTNSQTLSSEEHSSRLAVDTTAKSRKLSTHSRRQQFTSSLQSSPRLTSTADSLVSRKPIVTLKPSSYHAAPSFSHVQGNTSNLKTEDEIDPVILILIPIMAILFLVAIIVAFVMWMKHRKKRKRAENRNAENGSELSRKGLVDSLENINNNRSTGFINRGADDRSSRSMSRTSSISNLETIHEGNEPEEPEIYDL